MPIIEDPMIHIYLIYNIDIDKTFLQHDILVMTTIEYQTIQNPMIYINFSCNVDHDRTFQNLYHYNLIIRIFPHQNFDSLHPNQKNPLENPRESNPIMVGHSKCTPTFESKVVIKEIENCLLYNLESQLWAIECVEIFSSI